MEEGEKSHKAKGHSLDHAVLVINYHLKMIASSLQDIV